MSSLNLLLASAGLGGILSSKLKASDGIGQYDNFGKAVAVSSDGNTVAIGSPADDNSGGTDAGSVYVFTRSGTTWTEQARLQASDAAADDYFGSSVSLSSDGNTLAVGAPYDDTGAIFTVGSVYVFTRSGTTWIEQAKLQASDAAANDYFGSSVTLNGPGNTLAIGSTLDNNTAGTNAGSVYVFTRSGTTWTEQARLQASDAAADDYFGSSVALDIDGNTLAIGAYVDDNSGGTDAGSVYVFTRSGTTWTEQTRLQASDAAPYDSFGYSVALSSDGNTLAVGSPYFGDSNPTGAVYIFARSGTSWVQSAKLIPSNFGTVSIWFYFGWSIAFSSDAKTLLVGVYTNVPYGPGISYPLEAYQGMSFIFKNYGVGWAQKDVLRASGPLNYNGFGGSVALSSDGNTAVIGDYYLNIGSVYVVKNYQGTDKSYWINGLQLYASDAATDDNYGDSVALSGDGNTLAVGSTLDDTTATNVGSVYVYARTGTIWTYQTKLQSSDRLLGDSFGRVVALSNDGNTLAIGAYVDDNSGGTDAGSVYVFTRSGTTWTEQTRLQAGDAAASDKFGTSVALSSDGNTLAVGSTLDNNTAGTDAGSAYVFTRSGTTWTQQARLQASDAAPSDKFGNSIALSSDGNTLAVGASADDNFIDPDAGSVYVFTRSGTTWTEQARVQSNGVAPYDSFGYSVALSSDGNTLAVGAALADTSGNSNAGSTYVFIRSGTTWTQQTRLQAGDPSINDYFGYSVALSNDGNTLAVGATADSNSAGTNAGSVYTFTRTGTTWAQQARIQATDASPESYLGHSVALSGDGNTLAAGAHLGDVGQVANAGSVTIRYKVQV